MITYEQSIRESKFFADDPEFFVKEKKLFGVRDYTGYWFKRSQQIENYWPNNVYGVAKNIKKYIADGTGYPVINRLSLPGVTRHGIHFEMYTHKDLHPYEFPDPNEDIEFKTAMSWPYFMDPIYERNVGKERVLPTAAPFCYSYENWKKARKEDETFKNVERSGTLFFPRHSTHSRIVITDYKKMWNDLEDLPDHMKPIKVCVFHKDVDLLVAEEAKKRGYEVFCCGHTMDQTFHWRLLDLFATTKYACSQKITSNAIYAAYTGVHYFLLDAKMKYMNMDQFTILRMKDGEDPEKAIEHKKQVTEQFRAIDESMYEERHQTARRLLSADRMVSPKKYLRQLTELAENYSDINIYKYKLIHPINLERTELLSR